MGKLLSSDGSGSIQEMAEAVQEAFSGDISGSSFRAQAGAKGDSFVGGNSRLARPVDVRIFDGGLSERFPRKTFLVLCP
jgi:hypothetical protein